MKFALCLSVAVVIFVVVSSERCSHDDDCKHVTCDSSTTVGCSHNECTCLADNHPCSSTHCQDRGDCSSCSCGSDRQHHCRFGRCTCGFTGIGK